MLDKKISNEKLLDENSSKKKLSDKKESKKNLSNNKISDEKLPNENISSQKSFDEKINKKTMSDNKERNFYNAISISYAVGDFIAFESFLTDTEKINLKEIIFLSSPNTMNVHLDLIKKSNFYNMNNTKLTFLGKPNPSFEKRYQILNNYISQELVGKKYQVLIDHNFYDNNKKYKLLIENENIKNYSFAKQKLANIIKFGLPDKYIAICAWGIKQKRKEFDLNDWEEVFKILQKHNIKGVLINDQVWYCQKSWYFNKVSTNEHIIDLTGKTTIFEAMEIVKNAKGFLGYDGLLSIIATQSLAEDSIMIKAKDESGAVRRFNYFYSNLKNIKTIVKEIKFSKYNFKNI